MVGAGGSIPPRGPCSVYQCSTIMRHVQFAASSSTASPSTAMNHYTMPIVSQAADAVKRSQGAKRPCSSDRLTIEHLFGIL